MQSFNHTINNKKNDHLFMPLNHMDSVYNSKNPLVRFVHRNRLKKIVENLPKKNFMKILDAGCGEGHLILEMYSINKKNIYYGVDVTEVALKSAKKRVPFARIEKMDLTNLKFEDNYFDIIVCSEVLEHIYNYNKVIDELTRVLKKGGFLILTFPNEFLWVLSRLFLFRWPIKVPDHVNSFSPNQIRKIVKMKLINQINLPFGLPFFFSLGCLMKFEKN
ncbi:MAG: class I SAM-dependent methyltransferase [Candidatus Woesearchaeota archaeon]